MTVYIFDKDQNVRTPVADGDAVDLIHDENNRSITVSVKKTYQVKNGEYVGFLCVDGHFRMFCVTGSALNDDKGVHDITATDAIVQEMKEAIVEEKQQLDVPLNEALAGLVPNSTWTVSGAAPDRVEKYRAYYTSLWNMVTTLEQLYEWRVDAYYTFGNGKIVSRVLEMVDPAPVFRGRILESGKDASKVYITSTGRPITRLYGLGAAQGTQDEPKNLTFADVVWSVENGDPVDKPKGQTWVEDPQAVEENGLHTDTFSAQDAENADDLLKKTWEELQRKKKAAIAIKATVADMEMVPGYSHMQIRLGDLVAVLLKDGTSVEAKIIAIKRHYFRPWMTTITIGEKTASIQTQVSSLITSATHTFERLTIYKNRFQEDEALIQLNAEHIQLNAETIIQHAELFIQLETANEEVLLRLDGVNKTLEAQAETILLQAEEINIKANKTYVDDLVAKFVTAEEVVANILEVVDSAYVSEMLEVADLRVGGVTAGWVSADGVEANDVSAGSLYIGGVSFEPSNYPTFSDLTARLGSYATRSFVIENYATNASVSTTFSGLFNDIAVLESRVSALESK